MIGLFMPLSFILQLQMWMQLTVLMLLLKLLLLIIMLIMMCVVGSRVQAVDNETHDKPPYLNRLETLGHVPDTSQANF